MNLEKLEDILNDSGIVFLSYGGMLSQDLISNMTEALEKEIQNNMVHLTTSVNIFTIFIELSQNIMNYSKEKNLSSKPRGLVLVGYENTEDKYYVLSRNIITDEDKEFLDKKLNSIQNMSKDELKQKYKELRKNSKQMHEKGAGIGFYEIAKRCNQIEYEFKELDKGNYQFSFIANINNK